MIFFKKNERTHTHTPSRCEKILSAIVIAFYRYIQCNGKLKTQSTNHKSSAEGKNRWIPQNRTKMQIKYCTMWILAACAALSIVDIIRGPISFPEAAFPQTDILQKHQLFCGWWDLRSPEDMSVSCVCIKRLSSIGGLQCTPPAIVKEVV